jgi:hypothetical protein
MSGCVARVDRFTVMPSHICAGTPVKLDMQVAGTPTLTIDPPLQPQVGQVYVPQATTHFVVAVTRWPPNTKAGSETEVRVMPGTPPAPDEVTASVSCVGDKVTGTLLRSPEEWDRRLRVGIVESGEDREVIVSHEGREARLTVQKPSTSAFDGTSLGGAWVISSPLQSQERCAGVPPPPNLLNVSAEVRCER